MANGSEAFGAAGGFAADNAKTQFTPFRRNVLIVTLCFFLVLAAVGTYESYQQKSYLPLLERTIFKVGGSDVQLARAMEEYASGAAPTFTGFFQKSFPTFLWWYVKFALTIVGNLYFIFFFGLLLYWMFEFINNTSALRNVLLALGTYVLIMLMVGTMFYVTDMNGQTVPAGRLKALNHYISHSYPFQGVVKTVVYFIKPESLKRLADWTENSKLAPLITNVPQGTMNLSFNETNITQVNAT